MFHNYVFVRFHEDADDIIIISRKRAHLYGAWEGIIGLWIDQ